MLELDESSWLICSEVRSDRFEVNMTDSSEKDAREPYNCKGKREEHKGDAEEDDPKHDKKWDR